MNAGSSSRAPRQWSKAPLCAPRGSTIRGRLPRRKPRPPRSQPNQHLSPPLSPRRPGRDRSPGRSQRLSPRPRLPRKQKKSSNLRHRPPRRRLSPKQRPSRSPVPARHYLATVRRAPNPPRGPRPSRQGRPPRNSVPRRRRLGGRPLRGLLSRPPGPPPRPVARLPCLVHADRVRGTIRMPLARGCRVLAHRGKRVLAREHPGRARRVLDRLVPGGQRVHAPAGHALTRG